MTWLLILILLSTCMGALALGAFLWSLRGGQYDDMEGAATRILFDDPPPRSGVALALPERGAAQGQVAAKR